MAPGRNLKWIGSSVNLACALVRYSVSVGHCYILDLVTFATNKATTIAGDVPCSALSLHRCEISRSGSRGLVRIFFGPSLINSASTCNTDHVPVAYAI